MTLRIGIDLGGTKIEGVVIDEDRNVLTRERRTTPARCGYTPILTTICELVADLENRVDQPCRVGVGTPGALSIASDRLQNSNTTSLNGQPLKVDLERELARPIRIENDANCFTLSEAIHGVARDYRVVFGVIMGTGVGGGIVIGGRLLRGHHHIGGEWGHNILERDGPLCYCGKRGCVETFLSGPGLVQNYVACGGGPDRSPATIALLAEQGDPIAELVMQRFLDRFGRALATVINIVDPDAIVLGGGLSNIECLYSDARHHVARYVFSDAFESPILRNLHGDSSGVFGAAELWPATT